MSDTGGRSHYDLVQSKQRDSEDFEKWVLGHGRSFCEVWRRYQGLEIEDFLAVEDYGWNFWETNLYRGGGGSPYGWEKPGDEMVHWAESIRAWEAWPCFCPTGWLGCDLTSLRLSFLGCKFGPCLGRWSWGSQEMKNMWKHLENARRLVTFKKILQGLEWLKIRLRKWRKASLIAWGRGTGVALKVLPDVFPKVQGGGDPPQGGFC